MINQYEIPLGPLTARMVVDILGTEYIFQTQYREAPEAGWMLDIDDSATDQPLVHGIPLVTGADLLEQYAYLDFGNARLIMFDDLNRGRSPAYEELGVSFHLLIETDDEADL